MLWVQFLRTRLIVIIAVLAIFSFSFFSPAFISYGRHICSTCKGLLPAKVYLTLSPDSSSNPLSSVSNNYFTITYYDTLSGNQFSTVDYGGTVTFTTAGPVTISGSSSASDSNGEEWCLDSGCAPAIFTVDGCLTPGCTDSVTYIYYDALAQTVSDSFGGSSPNVPPVCLSYLAMPTTAGGTDSRTIGAVALSSVQQIAALRSSSASAPAYLLDSSGDVWTTSSSTWTITAADAITNPISYSNSGTTETNEPSVSATCLDADQSMSATGTIPLTATTSSSFQWLVSTDEGVTFDLASQCSTNTGPVPSMTSTETCDILANSLTTGYNYAFELQALDSSGGTAFTSSPSSVITVSTALGTPNNPISSATYLDADQSLTVTGSVPSTGVGPYSWQWQVTDGGIAYSPPCAPSGSGASPGSTETCNIPGGTLVPGIYEFAFVVTSDSASPPESGTSGSTEVTVSPALTPVATPSASATALDQDQILSLSDTLPSTGSLYLFWQWMYSVGGGSYVPVGSSSTGPNCPGTISKPESSGYGGYGGTVTCNIPGSDFTVGQTYNFELSVTDGADVPETQTSSAATVVVNTALTVPSAPTVGATALDADQPLTLTDTISTGTAPYTPQWMMVSGGTTTSAPCSSTSESGATLTCIIMGNALTAPGTYSFELQVTDSASTPETSPLSPASSTVTVNTALSPPTAPTVSTTTLNVNQPLIVTGAIPSGGTSTYSWQWLISIDGGSYVPATQCAANSGTGATASTTETCYISGGTLAAGPTYSFELQVTDSATTPESATSPPSPTVVTQFQVTFTETGLGSRATGTVLTVNGVSYSLSQLPTPTLLLNPGTSFTYSSIVNTHLLGVRFSLSGVGGPESGNTVTGSGTITGSYVTQFLVAFVAFPDSGGSTTPSSSTWVNQGATIPISATASSGYKFESWFSILPKFIVIASPSSPSTAATVNAPGIVAAIFIPTVQLSLSFSSGTVAPGNSLTTTATVSGGSQYVSLKLVSSLPAGVSVSFAKTSLIDNPSGVMDLVTISSSARTPAGTYSIVIQATGADGQTSSTTYTLTIT
jgi:hypothetical protein